jgi:putative peptide zinc metalloprotease protein
MREVTTGAMTPTQRLVLLARAPLLASLSAASLEALAGVVLEEHHAAGAIVADEGEAGDRLYIVAHGRADVSARGPSSAVALGALDVGHVFCDIHLGEAADERQATLTAATPLTLLALHRTDWWALSTAHPDIATAFAAAHETFLVTKFLKQATPFAALAPEQVAQLVSRLERLRVAAGTEIVRQGDEGDACYLLRAGRAEVVATLDDTPERRLATLYPGKLFGESALLTEAPRNATVRALEPCDLFVLRRSVLLEVMGKDRRVANELFQLVRQHGRPSRAPGITIHPRTTPEGETITILRNPATGTYYRLSPQGWFIWQRLDGRHTLRDLALEYHREFHAFSPDAIAEVIHGLSEAGFLEQRALKRDAVEQASPSRVERLAQRARAILEWRVTIHNVDRVIAWIYRHGGFLVYTRLAQGLFPLLVVAGLLTFALAQARATAVLAQPGGSLLLLFLIPAFFITTVFHELGHALTTKHFGRSVLSGGFGWYWFGPITYMDTTDMWLEGRWPRIAVSIAGPYSDLLLGSLAAVVAFLAPNPLVTSALWQCAAMAFLNVLINCNILLEYDAYYVLMDLLDRPNLRAGSLRWLGTELPRALRRMTPGAIWRAHWVELVYGIGAVAYILVASALTVIVYRLTIQGWMAHVLPALLANSLAWILAFVVAGMCVLGVVGELRGE